MATPSPDNQTPNLAALLAEYERLSKEQLNLIPTPWLIRLRRLVHEHPILAKQLDEALKGELDREARTMI